VPAVGEVSCEQPTKMNIMEGMSWVVQGMQSGDLGIFFYAGHGDEVPDENGDEQSGMDQVLLPSDFERCGPLLDDWIYERMVRGVPPGARLTAIVDGTFGRRRRPTSGPSDGVRNSCCRTLCFLTCPPCPAVCVTDL
jgi:Caspase domain